jgi:GGDEF domain-containing protein
VKHQEHGFRRIVVPGVLLVIVAWVTSGIGDDGSRRVVAAVAVLLACLTVGSLVVVTRRLRLVEHDLRRLTGRWEELAATDQLTGLGNRTRLLEDVQLLIARGSRYGHSFGLALFELPEALDADELQVAAELLAAEARSADSCYRIAENRLVALLAEQDLLGAGLAAGRIGRALRESGFAEVRHGVAGFSPWLEGGAAAVLLEAERDLHPVDDAPPEDPVAPPP